MLELNSPKLELRSNCRSGRSLVYSDPFLSNCVRRSWSNIDRRRGSEEMSFNNEFTKVTGDYSANSCPPGMGLYIRPSVGRFKDGEVPPLHMKGNVQRPSHNASYSMAPHSNYGMLKDQQIPQLVQQKSTHSESSGSDLGPDK